VLLVAVPMIRPEASRVVAFTFPPALFWWSMIWTIRPEESRITSRQVWAGDTRDKANETKVERRSAFTAGETEVRSWSFEQSDKIVPLSPFKIHHQKTKIPHTPPLFVSPLLLQWQRHEPESFTPRLIFPIEEVPVFTMVTRNGEARNSKLGSMPPMQNKRHQWLW
jgi:hypothetical protein